MRSNEVLIDAFGRLPELVEAAVDGLSPEQLRWAPAEGANSIGWLVWHLTRVQDSHVAELLDGEQIYSRDGWASRFGLKPGSRDTGYGHTPAQVKEIAPESARVLVDYYAAVHERTIAFVEGLTDDDLDRVVDDNWDPPVTLGVRLISVYDDDAQHAGQAAYIRGLLS
ncbi:DinB family protein [Actinoplanes sp. NPDC051633]|uniref:mycothiol transferase n=1 Tax=Actinoplanes sp. NPDC051633 TaxID=3155670 RepID=UPI003433FC92